MNVSVELDKQVAVVTGGAQGLGRGIVEALARRGATVVIADIQKDKATETATEMRKQDLRVSAEEIDIADSASVDRCYNELQERHGRLDIAVHSAAVGQNVAPIVTLEDEEWRRVIDISLTGTFYCCRAAGRIMERQSRGCIVNLASINGQNPAALVAAYNVAKAGVISLTRTAALELAAYGVRVNAVSPGPVYTEFNRTLMAQRCASLDLTEDEMIEKVRSAIPMGRWGEPSDIAEAVAYLCGPHATWMTGEVLRVSGGLEGVSAVPPKRTAS